MKAPCEGGRGPGGAIAPKFDGWSDIFGGYPFSFDSFSWTSDPVTG